MMLVQSEPCCSSTEPHLIPQAYLSDLVCHPNLSKHKSKPSASRLKYLNTPETDTKLPFLFEATRMVCIVFFQDGKFSLL